MSDDKEEGHVVFYINSSADNTKIMLTLESTRAMNREDFLMAIEVFIKDAWEIEDDDIFFRDYEELAIDYQ